MNAYATAPVTTLWAEAALREVKSYVSMGNPHDESILRSYPVNAHASIGNPMGLEKTLKAHAAIAPPSAPMGALEQHGHGYPHVLVSFVYDQTQTFFSKRLGYSPESWMGDSGAFTVWTQGATVDLDAYIEWCHGYLALNPDFVAVSLDVRPGQPGSTPTRRERLRAMAESIDNGDKLRAAGIRIVEVYHLHEPLSHLELLLDRRQPGERIGIGGGATAEFCDTAFAFMRDRHGWDNLPPVHGFGVSPIAKLGARYPWFSCDSSGWMASARFGHGIGRRGDKTHDDTRTTNVGVRTLYLFRVLDRWLRAERELTALWHQRGIRFAP